MEHSGTFWSIAQHFQKESSLFQVRHTTHAGCNGNLGFLSSVRALWFSFAGPRRCGTTEMRNHRHRGTKEIRTHTARRTPPPAARAPDHSLANQTRQDGLSDGHVTQAGPIGSLFLQRCDSLAAILLPRRTNVPVRGKRSEGNEAQKSGKAGDVVTWCRTLAPNGAESQTDFLRPFLPGESSLLSWMKPIGIGFPSLGTKRYH